MILMAIVLPLVAGYILTLMLIEITKVMFSFIPQFLMFITLLTYLNYYRHQFTFRILLLFFYHLYFLFHLFFGKIPVIYPNPLINLS
jgi:hypothetical protein